MNTRPARLHAAFTLIELICTMSIVAVLVALILPTLSGYREKADGMQCMNNLRQLGSAVQNFAAQNDGRFPEIEPDPEHPIYPPEEHAKGLLETFATLGVTEDTVKCPADVKTYKTYLARKTSYEWRPYVDDELQSNPQIFTRGGQRTMPLSKIILTFDTERVHGLESNFRSKKNYLYADGHVRPYWDTAPRPAQKK
jgi:prepilin-type N-terminal cleavage/methylation domain-containing protein/prepilin-type processing-associated H-X9-DG protein